MVVLVWLANLQHLKMFQLIISEKCSLTRSFPTISAHSSWSMMVRFGQNHEYVNHQDSPSYNLCTTEHNPGSTKLVAYKYIISTYIFVQTLSNLSVKPAVSALKGSCLRLYVEICLDFLAWMLHEAAHFLLLRFMQFVSSQFLSSRDAVKCKRCWCLKLKLGHRLKTAESQLWLFRFSVQTSAELQMF